MASPDLAALTILLARVESATGPDRVLDADLWWRLEPIPSGICFQNGATGLPRPLDHAAPMPGGMGRAGVHAMAPAFTASIDTLLALCSRLGFDHRDISCLLTETMQTAWRWSGVGFVAALSLALVASILRALGAGAETQDAEAAAAMRGTS